MSAENVILSDKEHEMTDDEKLGLIQKRFPEIISRLNKEKETDYGNVTPREKLFFKDVFETLSRTDKKLFLELYQNITTASGQMVAKSRAMEENFDLKKTSCRRVSGDDWG